MHIWRSAGGSNPDDEVGRPNTALIHFPSPVLSYIFGTFLRARKRSRPAGNYALHHFRRSSKRWRTLACVEHAKSARSAGADVEQSAAQTKCVFGKRDCPSDFFSLAGDRIGNDTVFSVYQIDQLQRGDKVYRSGPRIATFRFARVNHAGA